MWLDDLARGGLAQARTLTRSHFDHMAGRLVDAQAPGLAAAVQELSSALRVAHWQQAATMALGRLALLAESYGRQDALPDGLKADIRALTGWPVAQEDVLAAPPLADDWLVLAHRDEDLETGNGRYRRQWLWGRNSGRAALLLSFAFGNQNLNPPYPAGMTLPARLCFYPSATPQRALVRDADTPTLPPLSTVNGYGSLDGALAAQAAQLALNPLLAEMPWLLSDVTVLREGNDWRLCDRDGRTAPLRVNDGWALLALSGGHPLQVFGEWDGRELRLLNAWNTEEFL